ncbi:hypothetical protein As57867_003399, partial [Aphanomyces stellatus]
MNAAPSSSAPAALRHEEKQLLHWLNSLPLTCCLLVDTFAALQNGDVLFDVAAAIQTPSPLVLPPLKASSTARAAHKIQQVLSCVLPHGPKLRQGDGYQLRDPESTMDILDGHVPALCAVLGILRTLWVQKELRHQQKEYISDQVCKLRVAGQVPPPPPSSLTHKAKSSKTPSTTVSYIPRHRLVPKVFRPPAIAAPVVAWNTSTLVDASNDAPQQVPTQVDDDKTKKQPPLAQQLRKRFRVQSMVDPAWLSQPTAATNVLSSPPRQYAIELHEAYAVCRWIRALGIALPFDQSAQPMTADSFLDQAGRAFKDGVVLCQVAALLAYRTGKPFIKSKLRPMIDSPGCFVPQGCCISPQNAAQRRHNIQLALNFLSPTGDGTAPASSPLRHLDDPSSPHFVPEVWLFLHKLRKASTKSKPVSSNGQMPSPPPPSKPKNVRLPCVTHEQTQRVQEWLTSIGLSLPTSHSIYHPNEYLVGAISGSLARFAPEWRLVVVRQTHVLNRVAKISTPIKLHAKPTMLHQAKENVFQALSALRALQLAVVPPAYIASSDLILKGQFQVIWGLLYHLMQAFQEAPTHARASTKQKQTPPEDNGSPRVADDKVLVLDWLGSHGYLKPLECAYPSFEDIEAYCQSGSLLLLLASHLTGTPSPPVVKTSVPRHMALSNIEQALEMLRGLPAMPQRFLWCEDKARTPCVILGLLQDIRSVHPHGRHRGLSMSTKASVVASSMEECRPANPPPPPAPPISPLPRRYSSIHEDALGDKDGDDDHSATDSDGDGGDLMRVWHVDTEVSSTHQWRETDIDPAEDLFPQPHHHGIDASSSSSLPPWHVDDDVIP